jgi:hypothetical protein
LTESSTKRTRYRKIIEILTVVEGEAASAKLMEPVARRSLAPMQVASLSATTSDTITIKGGIIARIISMVDLNPFIEVDLVRCA